MVTWDEKRKQLTETGKDYKSLLPDVDRKAGISSWDQKRIELGAMPDTRPSTQIRNQLNQIMPPSSSGFGGFQNTTLGQAAAGNPQAADIYRKYTGYDIKPAPVQTPDPSNNSFLQNVGAFNDRLFNAATFGLNDLADKYIFGKIPSNDAYKQKLAEDQRIKNNFQAGPVAIVPEILGSILPGELAYRGAAALTKPLTSGLSSKIAQNTLRGAAAGALYQTGVEGVEILQNDNKQSALGRLGDIALSTVIGGAGDALISGAGRYISNRMGRGVERPIQTQTVTQPVRDPLSFDDYWKNGGKDTVSVAQVRRDYPNMALPNQYRLWKDLNRADFMVRNGLTLPEGRGTSRLADAARRTELPSNPSVIEAGPGATTARVNTTRNPFREKYENLIAQANTDPNVRNVNDLEQLWARTAEPTDPSLNELIDLAYPKRPKIPQSELLQRARTNQDLRQRYGVPIPVRDAESRIGARLGNEATDYVGAPAAADNIPSRSADDAMNAQLGREEPTTVSDRVETPDQPSIVRADDYSFEAPDIDATPTQSVPERIQPTAPDALQSAPGTRERRFSRTLAESDKTPEEFVTAMRQDANSTYNPITNEETIRLADGRVQNINEAKSYVMNSELKFTAEKAVTAQRLIDYYNSKGMTQEAVDIATKLSEEATNAGQFIQSLSLYNRLSPEGIVKFVKSRVASINEKLPANKRVLEVTPEVEQSVRELATISQKMTGVRELTSNAIEILERAQKGAKLTDTEANIVREFVDDANLFIRDATKPNTGTPSTIPTNESPRLRDQIVERLAQQEEAAKKRMLARRNTLNSNPLDVWADQIVIGASKMAKGTVKFTDWSAEMVSEFGEEIRPVLRNMFDRSKQAYRDSKNQITKLEQDVNVKLANKIIRDKELGESDSRALLITARKVAALAGEEKRMASQDLQKLLQAFDKPTIGRKLSSAQTVAQLLNPKTQVRNIIGNELFYRVERLNKILATPLDIARSKITGKDRYVTFKTNNQGQFWKNWMTGLKAGWNGTNINGLQSQFDLTAPAFQGKYNPLTYMEKALGASLRSFDNASYMRAYNQTLGEMGTLDALNNGITGRDAIKEHVQNYIARASDDILQMADQYGRYVTAQDNNALSMGLSKLKRGLNLNRSFGIGDLVLKYPKTPGALLMRAFEYSPAGFVRSAYLLNRSIRHLEAENMREAVLSISRATIGTVGFAGMGYALMDNGILTTAASKDKDVRSLAQSAGQTQYQINFSALRRYVQSGFKQQDPKTRDGDLLYTYDWAQPVALSLSVGAEANKNIKQGKEAEKLLTGIGGTAVNSLAGGLNTLTEQSVLSGVKDFFSTYPGQTVSDKLIDTLSDLPSSFIPTAFNQIRQVQDNTRRETMAPNLFEQAYNQTINKIPGLQKDLPTRYDSLGQESKVFQDDSEATRLFNIFLNPGTATRYELSPNAQTIMELINEFDDESLAPRVPAKKIQGNKLTGEQYSRLSQIQGEMVNDKISKLNPTLPSNTKAKKIDKIIDEAGKKARKQLFEEYNLKDNRERVSR